MKWTKEEREAIRATMEHWKDDIIKPLKVGVSIDDINLGSTTCPLCLSVTSCWDCPYFKMYETVCFESGEVYSNFQVSETVEDAINCYNKVADMIDAEHYE